MNQNTKFRHIYSFNNGNPIYHGYHDLNKRFNHGVDCLSDGTPIEDLGNYLLTESFIEPEQAFNLFLEKIES